MRFWQLERAVQDGDFQSVMELVESAKLAESPRRRRSLVASLCRSTSSEAIQLAIRFFDDPDEQVRALAASALADRDSPMAEDALVAALDSESEMVRAAAIKSLQSSGSARCVPAVEQLLKCDTRGIKARAVEALSSIADDASVKILIRILDEKDPYLRLCAVGALGEVGDVDVIPEIEARIDSETRINRPSFRAAVESIRKRAAT